MKFGIFFFLVSVCALSSGIDNEQAIALTMLEGIQAINVSALPSILTQEKIDAIIKAFHRLPGKELERLEVDLDKTVVAGSPEADLLINAWELRQLELKEAMKNVLQPVEYMVNLTKQLNSTEIILPKEEKLYILTQLESLLDDVDNARDFYSIGAWPTLVSHLTQDYPKSVRTLAAWTIGTAIKNTYDYQLWTIQQVSVTESSLCNTFEVSSCESGLTITAIDLLTMMLNDVGTLPGHESDMEYNMQKKAMYAISSAMRGNMDVQDFILSSKSVKLLDVIYTLATNFNGETDYDRSSIPPELMRKIWSSLSDLLEERTFIRGELAMLLKNNNINDSIIVPSTIDVLRNQVLLGDYLMNEDRWMKLAVNVASIYVNYLSSAVAINSMTTEESEKNISEKSNTAIAMHATLESILTFCKEVIVEQPFSVTLNAEWYTSLVQVLKLVIENFPANRFDAVHKIALLLQSIGI